MVYEQIYVLIRHLRFSHTDAYNLPVYKRNWFINRFVKEKKEEKSYYENLRNQNHKNKF